MERIYRKLFFIVFAVFIQVGWASAQIITSTQIDELVQRTLTAFNVPGIAVSVIKEGKVIHCKGYGVRSLKTNEKVDENTLFGIASNSKAFTAASLGILIDEGKLTWDDKVIDYIPEFRMYNAYVTEEFTIRDLLTHRGGLSTGAGELMVWPDSSDFTMKDIIHNLRYLKPISGFRTKYNYTNLLYMVAGEVIEKVSGKSYEEFVEERIMKPLQMNNSAGTYSRIKDKTNVIDAHAPVNGKVQVIQRDMLPFGNSAGGLNSSVADMNKWIIMQMNGGKYGSPEKQLFSKKVHEEMWNPQTIVPANTSPPYNTHFSAYGLGWFLSDVKGYKQVTHTGALGGMVSHVTLLPELQLGIIVLANQQSSTALQAIINTIKDSYLGLPAIDRVKISSETERKNIAKADSITDKIWNEIAMERKKSTAKTNYNAFTGKYKDSWLGEIVIVEKNGKLRFDSKRSPKLSGEIFFYKNNTFIVKWDLRSLDADAYMYFQIDKDGKPASIKMKPMSSLTAFIFDFQDLDLKRIGE